MHAQSILGQLRKRWSSIESTLGRSLVMLVCLSQRCKIGWILRNVVFCTIMAISRQKEGRNRNYALLLSDNFKGFLSCTVHSSTAHSIPSSSLEHCMCKTNIRPGRDLNPIPYVSSHNRTKWVIRTGTQSCTWLNYRPMYHEKTITNTFSLI